MPSSVAKVSLKRKTGAKMPKGIVLSTPLSLNESSISGG